jgi:ABC-type phosphate/phosphonate transport system substrate-binding protein
MSERIANARMYAVTPTVEASWRSLLEHVARDACVALHYLPWPAPQPLEPLWQRPDLGCVFMCGYPIALGLADVVPLAAPVPRAPWAGGRPLYRSDLIVRADAPFRALEDTFGARAGWTVEHSHSGFNAFRHHLLRYRSATRPTLYGAMTGHLVTARRVLDAVRAGEIDVGPLDAYWHLLIARHQPALVEGIRVLAATDTATLPALVAAAGTPPATVDALRAALLDAASRPWFAPSAEELLIEGFAAVGPADYALTLARDCEARAADYPFPA